VLLAQNWEDTASAELVGAECWDDGGCKANGCTPPDPDCAQCWDDGLCKPSGCTPADPDCGPPPPVTRNLVVKRYTSSVCSNSDADAIFAESTDILQTDDGVSDVACSVILQRSGSVTSFTTGDGSLDNQTEFDAVDNLSGNVKVVNAINWCGVIGFNFVGCAYSPATSQAVMRMSTTHLEGILWAHEYGHTQGLPHRSGDNVMDPTITSSHTHVNANECAAYR